MIITSSSLAANKFDMNRIYINYSHLCVSHDSLSYFPRSLSFYSRNGSFARSYPNLGVCGTGSAPASPRKKANVNFQQIRLHHEVTGDIICPSMVQGIDHLRDPRLNKGLAFSLQERQTLGIHGLQPARIKSQEEQLELCKMSIMR